MLVPDSHTMSIGVSATPDAMDLRLSGCFDIQTAPLLSGVLDALHGRDVAIDLEGLSFMDGAAWLAVMDLERRVTEWGRTLSVVNVPWRIRKLFEATQTEYLLVEVAAAR